jgi:hypothetical protein
LLLVRVLQAVAVLLAGLIGLHLPRAFMLLYGLVALLIGAVLCWPTVRQGAPRRSRWLLAIPLLFSSLAYGAGMVHWGFWRWPADRLDLINALLLPTLLFLAGLQVPRLGRRFGSALLLAYGAGALVYLLAALAVSRSPWWAVDQLFSQSISTAWGPGSGAPLNVRSLEQNAILAMALVPLAIQLLLPRWAPPAASATPGRSRLLAGAVLLAALLGLHGVWSLQGRLGWLALALAAVPAILALLAKARRQPLAGICLALAAIAAGGLGRQLLALRAGTGWGQGLCDERWSLQWALLSHLGEAPWGGHQLRVTYRLCNGSAASFGPSDATVTMAHNVLLDMYNDVGWLAPLLLLAALLPALVVVLRGFGAAARARSWNWRVALAWAWFAVLAMQWIFQPLLYTDGLLYYYSFFVLGVGVAEFDLAEPVSRGLRRPQALIDRGSGFSGLP